MDQDIIKTWKEISYNNPEYKPEDIIKILQCMYNIDFKDIINAISKEVNKNLIN